MAELNARPLTVVPGRLSALAALAMILLLCLAFPHANAASLAPEEEWVVGALLDRTGLRSSQDAIIEAALNVAVDEINAWLMESGESLRIRLRVEDTRSDPERSLIQLRNMATDGVRAVIGPSTSQEIFHVRSFAENQGMILISPSSTAPSLAIPGDNIFRLMPDDTYQGAALARRMWDDGIRAVVTLRRDDLYAEDLQWHAQEAFERLGMGGLSLFWDDEALPSVKVYPGVKYYPSTVNFISEVDALSDQVAQAVREYGARRVAVHLIAFDEAVPIMVQASQSPVLSLVRWYGADGTAKAPSIIANERAAAFAAETNFQATLVAESKESAFTALAEKAGRAFGVQLDAAGAAAYDALWILVKARLAAGSSSVSALSDAFATIAQGHQGASGTIRLNDAGDRASDMFDFWRVQRTSAGYEWRTAR